MTSKLDMDSCLSSEQFLRPDQGSILASFLNFLFHPVAPQVGLVGYGTIGRGVAQRALGLQMRVVAVDARPPATTPPGLAWIGSDAELPRLLAEADFVVVAVPLLPATRNMIGVKDGD